ncbi:hypothetical protein [Paenibacillus caui]|uniref:hypothetical protein n=1 Tax=Paenibacillus caui TaxID=2873927 RepID=UPI001CA9649E|nr:hypothetical protein [Paenibacillus caui]
MNRTWKIAIAAVLVGGGLWAGSLLNKSAEGAGVTSQPGSADDPVVTKSYVDQQIQQALGGAKATPPTSSSPEEATVPSNNKVEVVTVKPGEKLMAAAGAEFIVRVGKGVVYSSDSNGVADLTDGLDILNGKPVGNNHLLSFPREGRGIMVEDGNKNNLTVMVRGGYRIEK